MLYIKKAGSRYYRESRQQMRSLPIKATEALDLLATGQAELVERFIWEPEPKGLAPDNVLDITARIKQRQKQEESDSMIERFKADYLPFLSPADLDLLAGAKDEGGETLMKICLRIDLERSRA